MKVFMLIYSFNSKSTLISSLRKFITAEARKANLKSRSFGIFFSLSAKPKVALGLKIQRWGIFDHRTYSLMIELKLKWSISSPGHVS